MIRRPTAILGVALVCGACNATVPPTAAVTESSRTGVVTRVADGDTIDVELQEGATTTIRLAGINAPELGECYGPEARDYLEDLVEDRKVGLETVGTDLFDRVLGYLLIDGRPVNLEMVAEGMALGMTPEDDDTRGSDILAAEESAYRLGLGLWRAAACGREDDLPRLVIDGGSSTPNPVGPDQDHLELEAIAIVNEGDETVDITGWVLRDESSLHRYMFAPTTLGPGATLEVVSSDPGWEPSGDAVWNNAGDIVLLQDQHGTVVDRWRY